MSRPAGRDRGARRRMRLLGRRLRRGPRALLRGAVRRWRSSMQLRVITSALAIGLLTVAALGAYISESIRDGLFEQRLEQIDVESARTAEDVRAQLRSSTATNRAEVQGLVYDVVESSRGRGSVSREVFLWRLPGDQPSLVIDASTSPELAPLITQQMRTATAETDGQVMQSVAIPVDVDAEDPGILPGVVVGSTVQVPVAGTFELYFLYDLAPEQETLTFLQNILLVGAAFLVALVGVITWLVTRQAVHPVRRAALVAERLADGRLEERMPVRGRDEMATLARSFNEMAAGLQEQIGRMEALSSMQRRFVSDVSHELRTPLTTIRMASEVLHASSADFDPASRRSAELLQTQLDRFEDLLADLLEISRFDAGAAVLDAERRDVRDVVSAAVDHAAPLAERKEVWLSVHLGDDPVTADVDPRRVERIIRNLVVNAIEHAEDRPVEVTVAGDRHAVAVVVRDHGVGMSTDEVEHVFDRFWRADPARARTSGGTGLGLAISLEDAHLHGGWLEAWGRPGQGASFRLTLPRRAGIQLSSSPVPLVPEPTTERGMGEPWTVTTLAPAERDRSGPSALPDLAGGPVVSPTEEPGATRPGLEVT
ncbi:MtrAB system histidine kinase MtrB [Oerskovia flava]|uniref:MtrAB system histidine kinase MtrB n=1 Tax=Oerskovia flava TaxID=2986422 RepID=UPI002AD53318|nr:MtrAB system histidine kinase MtrB [Oerskovia sp. JB1-3-2]